MNLIPPASTIEFRLNGKDQRIVAPPMRRLSRVLREDLGMTGTKVGCDAGDCGACTVLIDGAPVCACLTPLGQAAGRDLTTIEGLGSESKQTALQRSFHFHGAAQCGICTPGMLMAASALLEQTPRPSESEVMTALGGVLCRCTGYRKIITAVMTAHVFKSHDLEVTGLGEAGTPAMRVDGLSQVMGTERFGDDVAPVESLWLRLIRSPYAAARFEFGDRDKFLRRHPGIDLVLTAADIPGANEHGVIPVFRDQPVFADGRVRFKGEAIAAVVGEATAITMLDDAEFPVSWEEEPAVSTIEQALHPDAPQLHQNRPGNILVRGRMRRGDASSAIDEAAFVVDGEFDTAFVEHAYIEPEAGFAQRKGDRIEIHVTTQTPYMDRDEVARVLALDPEDVRIVPTACGGGFGGKLDLSVQPYLALAAWHLDRPVRCLYSRPESMATTTKRHPARMRVAIGADETGALSAMRFEADFNTGAYASWGPTVAGRVPVHCSGPYRIPNVAADTCAVLTNLAPSGAFRGFGTPQAAIARESLLDQLADKVGIDRLEFRLRNALRVGDMTPSGQMLDSSVGIGACLEALRYAWRDACDAAATHNADASRAARRGVGIACMWYGCGNTALSNPSTIRLALKNDGTLVLYQGAVDIGQGSSTVLAQIVASVVRVDLGRIQLINADTDLTPDAGKTSASRQTFVSGRAAMLAAEDLKRQLLRHANAGDTASVHIDGSKALARHGSDTLEVDLKKLPATPDGMVLTAEATFDPPTTTLDENGQGTPYATYAFGAQIAEVLVDTDLGTVKVIGVTAAHDVGKAINPQLIEGQVEGGVAQGIGMALMEEYVPGRNANLHDYLIPTVGDVPPIKTILIEDADPLGPFGAKGVGEPALIPTAAAILNAIRHATGVTITRVPATPDRVRATLLRAGQQS
jgi:CO/xanthine dehydrogenase Mo-binding subunit/aerobic-type carbon monoxide dehydrogenase small subunit (CoxS/CutS family)